MDSIQQYLLENTGNFSTTDWKNLKNLLDRHFYEYRFNVYRGTHNMDWSLNLLIQEHKTEHTIELTEEEWLGIKHLIDKPPKWDSHCDFIDALRGISPCKGSIRFIFPSCLTKDERQKIHMTKNRLYESKTFLYYAGDFDINKKIKHGKNIIEKLNLFIH